MKPRHRAQRRLDRPSPGRRTREVRPLVERLEQRMTYLDPEIVLPIPQKQLVFERKPTPLPAYKQVEPKPNAPLLKRVVRHPYAMEPAGARKLSLIDEELQQGRAPELPRREQVETVFATTRRARQRPAPQAPEIPVRERPFSRQREARADAQLVERFGVDA